MYKHSNVLITGGLGLIGSTIAAKLVRNGSNVTILDAELPRYGGNHFNVVDIKNDITVVKGDIRDKETVEAVVKSKDIIFNLAAQVDYNHSLEDPYLDLDINCKGQLLVLESCRKQNPDTKIVFSGSRMQYGKIISNPVSEEHPTNPLSVYGIHKLTAEKYYQAYYNHYGIKSVCFRITNPYGPRAQMKHPYYCVVNWFIRQAIEDREISIFGDGKQKRDYIYVDDIADAMIASAYNENTDGKVYNLGSGQSIEFNEMVETIVEVVGKGSVSRNEWPRTWKNVETGSFEANIEKIKKDIGWIPETEFRRGIARTVDYYKRYKQHYW